MTAHITTLANGLRIVTERMPHVQTVALGVYVATGARHERVEEHGISHLLEHMAFKGTARRTARQIAEEIEQVGGDLNAATGLETTAYYARVLAGDEGVALDILADILREPTFEPADLAREKDVILQEIAGIADSPEELAYDLLQARAFPDQPLGRPIIGTKDSVTAITALQLRSFLESRYGARQMVISAAGAVDHDALVARVKKRFGSLPAPEPTTAELGRYAGGVASSSKAFEQTHLLAGFEGVAYVHPDFFALLVLSSILGGGMSSRLFQEARENRGLCYSIYASAWALGDTGMLTVHAATGADQITDLTAVVAAELGKMVAAPPSPQELDRAKAQIKVGTVSALESPGARSDQMARHLHTLGRLVDASELIARIDAVSGADVERIARRVIGGKPTVAVVGAGRASAKAAKAAFDALVLAGADAGQPAPQPKPPVEAASKRARGSTAGKRRVARG